MMHRSDTRLHASTRLGAATRVIICTLAILFVLGCAAAVGDDYRPTPVSDSEVPTLSAAAQKELGGDDLVFVVAVDRDGNARHFRAGGVEVREGGDLDGRGVPAARIRRVDSSALVVFEQNPICYAYKSGGGSYIFCIPD